MVSLCHSIYIEDLSKISLRTYDTDIPPLLKSDRWLSGCMMRHQLCLSYRMTKQFVLGAKQAVYSQAHLLHKAKQHSLVTYIK